jgi:hypothetical protein
MNNNSIHELPTVFPMQTKTGEVVTDEVCTCGHNRSAHSDLYVSTNFAEGEPIAFGHGECAVRGCTCIKFKRKSFIIKP